MAMTARASTSGWYRYRAARSDGQVVKGRVWAESDREVRAAVGAEGLYLISVTLAESRPVLFGRPSRRDLAIIFRSVASLVASGLPLEKALGATEPLASGALAQTLRDARRRLAGGASLAESLGNSQLIPGHVVGILEAGERGSRLDAALESAATQLEREAELRSRIRSALAYPALIGVTGLLSVAVIGTVIVPRFAELLSDMGQELPPSTRLLLLAGSWLRAASLPLALAAVIGLVSLVWWCDTPRGRRILHRFLHLLPLIGSLRLTFSTSRLCRALGGMLETGMPLLAALHAARDAAGDAVTGERIERVRERVARGERLTRSLEAEGAVTSGAVRLVAVGEGSGELATMFGRAADLAERDGERRVRTLVSLLEPGLVVLLGGLVAFVAAALLRAVYAMRPGIMG